MTTNDDNNNIDINLDFSNLEIPSSDVDTTITKSFENPQTTKSENLNTNNFVDNPNISETNEFKSEQEKIEQEETKQSDTNLTNPYQSNQIPNNFDEIIQESSSTINQENSIPDINPDDNTQETINQTKENTQDNKDNDDRLKKEDQIVEEKKDYTTIKTQNTDDIKLKSIQDIKTIEDKTNSESQKIINELIQTPTNTTIEINNNPEIDKKTDEPTLKTQNNTNNQSFDLDSIIQQDQKLETTVPTVQNNILPPTTENNSIINTTNDLINITNNDTIIPTNNTIWNTIDNNQTPIASNIQNTIPTTKKSWWFKKTLTTIIFLLLTIASAYVLKTMYPIQYENIKANIFSIWEQSKDNNSIENIIENTGTTNDELLIDGEFIVEEQNDQLTWLESINTWNSITTIESDPWFNGFSDLEGIITWSNNTPTQIEQLTQELRNFISEWNTFLQLWTKTNDKTMIKYWTYISKKAESIVQSIENKEEIDIDSINWYITQFSWYLNQLTNLSYDKDSNSLQTPTTVQTWDWIQADPTNFNNQEPEQNIDQDSGENSQDLIQDIDWDLPQQ